MDPRSPPHGRDQGTAQGVPWFDAGGGGATVISYTTEGGMTTTEVRGDHRKRGHGDVKLEVVVIPGWVPTSEWLSGCALLDDSGFVLTDRSPYPVLHPSS